MELAGVFCVGNCASGHIFEPNIRETVTSAKISRRNVPISQSTLKSLHVEILQKLNKKKTKKKKTGIKSGTERNMNDNENKAD